MLQRIVRNSGGLALLGQAAAIDVGVEKGLEVVVAGHLVALAALFVKPHPQPPVLNVGVLDLHRQRRADAGEAVEVVASDVLWMGTLQGLLHGQR